MKQFFYSVLMFCVCAALFSCAHHTPAPSDESGQNSNGEIPTWGAPPPPAPPPTSSQETARQRAEEARRNAMQQRMQQRERELLARKQAEEAKRRAQAEATANLNGGEDIKQFPWPPPKPSTFSIIQRKYLPLKSAGHRLKDVENVIRESLDATGYYDVSYYGVESQPDAFVMATRLEQINQDATPKTGEERWVGTTNRDTQFSLKNYLNELFYAEQGAYRIILFVVTTESFTFSKKSVNAKKAENWVSNGHVSLPKLMANNDFTEHHQVYALVYEFDKSGDENAKESVNLRIPGKHQARTHLENAGIWKLIARD